MSTGNKLHILQTQNYQQVIACATPEDAILLTASSIYLLTNQSIVNLITNKFTTIYALLPDLITANLETTQIMVQNPQIIVINYQEFVTLTIKFTKNITW